MTNKEKAMLTYQALQNRKMMKELKKQKESMEYAAENYAAKYRKYNTGNRRGSKYNF